jgi:molecular chaperone GrpE
MKKKKNNPEDLPADANDVAPDTEGQDVPQSIEAERDDLLARLQRVSADYVNYQKRVQRERVDERAFAQADVIKALLGVLDDMEHALAAVSDADEDDPFYRGLKMVHDKMLETLGQFGCKVIEAQGQPLDPERHAAIMQQPSEDEPNTVLAVVQQGYELNGRVLRPAGVVVAVEAPQAEDTDECQEE